MVTIEIKDKAGAIISISSFSEKKAEHITNTNQWNDAMNTILDSAKKVKNGVQ